MTFITTGDAAGTGCSGAREDLAETDFGVDVYLADLVAMIEFLHKFEQEHPEIFRKSYGFWERVRYHGDDYLIMEGGLIAMQWLDGDPSYSHQLAGWQLLEAAKQVTADYGVDLQIAA